MKKKPHKLPCELYDPAPPEPVCRPLDLSDAPAASDSVAPRPEDPPSL